MPILSKWIKMGRAFHVEKDSIDNQADGCSVVMCQNSGVQGTYFPEFPQCKAMQWFYHGTIWNLWITYGLYGFYMDSIWNSLELLGWRAMTAMTAMICVTEMKRRPWCGAQHLAGIQSWELITYLFSILSAFANHIVLQRNGVTVTFEHKGQLSFFERSTRSLKDTLHILKQSCFCCWTRLQL